MAEKDISIVLSPAKAREIQAMLDWWRRFPGKAGPADGQKGTRYYGTSIPIPKIGKAHDNIAPRAFGAVDMWIGAPGSEEASTFITSPVQEFNLLDRTITAGKFCWMFGQYIFGAVFPALEIEATLTEALALGVSAHAEVTSYSGGDDPGPTVLVRASAMQGATTIAASKPVYATWDDRAQIYRVRGWGC